MRNDLLRAIAGQRVEATPVMGDDEKTTILGAAGGYYGDDRWNDEDEEVYQRQRRRRNIIIAAVVGVLLLAGIVSAVLVLTSNKKPTTHAVTTVAVPNVVGQDKDAAVAALEGKGFKTNVTTASSTLDLKGKVTSTDPGGGAQVDKGITVTVVVGAGPNTLSVPDDAGKTVDDAKTAIQNQGFTGNITVNNVDNLQPKGTVVSTTPNANSSVAPDTSITLNVSKGTVTLPDLTGKTQAAAQQTLTQLGVAAGDIQFVDVERNDVPQGTVAGTEPGAGAQIGAKDQVTVQIAQPTPPTSTPTPTPTATPSATATPTP
jgi:serine/threonine-protein kinase